MVFTCATCINSSTCSVTCARAETIAGADYIGQRELTISRIELVPSSCGHSPENSAFPEFDFLRPVERFVLEKFYADGLSYREIAKKLKKKKNYVKSTISRARIKIGAFSSLYEGC